MFHQEVSRRNIPMKPHRCTLPCCLSGCFPHDQSGGCVNLVIQDGQRISGFSIIHCQGGTAKKVVRFRWWAANEVNSLKGVKELRQGLAPK